MTTSVPGVVAGVDERDKITSVAQLREMMRIRETRTEISRFEHGNTSEPGIGISIDWEAVEKLSRRHVVIPAKS